MTTTQAAPGKKVQLEIYSGDAGGLRERGQAFFEALQGQVVKPDDQVIFENLMLSVKGTKPKGPVQVGRQTAIKMSISKAPLSLDCPKCGHSHNEPQSNCTQCGTGMGLISL